MQLSAAIRASEKVLPSDEELLVALHTFGDADKRWNQRRLAGLTDAQLRDALSMEFGIYGGSSGPRMRDVIHRGGSDPAVWIDHDSEGLGRTNKPGRPELKGNALLAATRRVLRIRQPIAIGTTIPMF